MNTPNARGLFMGGLCRRLRGGQRTSDPKGSMKSWKTFRDEDTKEGEPNCAGSRWGSCEEKPPSRLLRLPSCLGSQVPSGAAMGMRENRKEQLSHQSVHPGCWPNTLRTTSALFILSEKRSAHCYKKFLFCADKYSMFKHLQY